MEIYLMRHAEPVRPMEWEGPDTSRPLTEKGRADVQNALAGMRKEKFSPKVILSSPLIRAKETAEITSQLNSHIELFLEADLASGVKSQPLRDVLIRFRDRAPVLVVGHMPDLALFASRVTQDPVLAEDGLKPGEIWALDSGPLEHNWGEGKLLWRRSINQWTSS